MILVESAALKEAWNADAEFQLAARYWDASLRLGIGDAPLCVQIAAGRVAEVRPSQTGDPVDLSIDGPDGEWERLLAPVPRPFYQSVYAASLHHGISVGGSPEDLFAYLAAVARMIDVLRTKVEIVPATSSESVS